MSAEYNVPPGEKPIHWRLGTTHEVKDIEAALRIVGWYRLRWNIEQLFCGDEKPGLRH